MASLYPDTEIAVTGMTGDPTFLQNEDTTDWYTADDPDSGNDVDLHVGMQNPDGVLDGTQNVDLHIRHTGNSGDSVSFTLDLYENGTQVETVISNTVTNTTGATFSGTFDSSSVSNGADVEFFFAATNNGGMPGTRDVAEVGYLTWTSSETIPTVTGSAALDGTADLVPTVQITTFSESVAGDWDSFQSETGVHHEQPTGTDWASSGTIEKGYPASDEGGSSLEAYWPFDEDSGTTANDVSGNSRDGTISGATPGATGILGTTAYTFDGTDDAVDTTWNGVGGSQNRTIACWIKTSSAADQIILVYGQESNTGAKWTFRLDEASTAGNYVPRVEISGGFIRGTTSVIDGSWHHVACVLEGTGTTDITLYVDGSAETVDGSSAETVNSDTTADPVRIGRRPDAWSGSGGRVFNGQLDEVRFYSRALSAQEITDLYNSTL